MQKCRSGPRRCLWLHKLIIKKSQFTNRCFPSGSTFLFHSSGPRHSLLLLSDLESLSTLFARFQAIDSPLDSVVARLAERLSRTPAAAQTMTEYMPGPTHKSTTIRCGPGPERVSIAHPRLQICTTLASHRSSLCTQLHAGLH